MRRIQPIPLCCLMAVLLSLFSGSVQAQLSDLTQPGDPIVATSNNSPGSEGVANAIDNQPTKYLNFDRVNTGFTVSPRVGLSVVQCLTLTSANDAPDRDPGSYVLSGSYDGSNFTQIASGNVPSFGPTGTNRFFKVVIDIQNNTPYVHYRLIFPTTAGNSTCCMQVSEVELLGFLAPTDVTQPSDPIVATSNNSPGSEGVRNAIDNQPTKYLNFDRLNTGFTVTPAVGPTLVSGLTLTSANDAPERDPASYTLEGSLDGTTFFPIASGSVPAFPTRFYKNYIFFSNSRAFRAYRLIFPTVVGPGGNSMQISEVELLGDVADIAQDITLPGDPIVATSNNSPGSEGVANAIDNQPTKYLNFDRVNTGFTVNPGARGLTVVSGLTLTSANDAPDRDPGSYVLSGSYDGTNFTEISSGTVPSFGTNRFLKVTVLFNNKIPYSQYRLIFPTTAGNSTCCMQVSEVELLGVLADTDVTTPGDPIVASSNNSPGSEGVANAIDNQPTKYLNFDELNTGFTVTPRVGGTILIGLSLTSANDAPARDPASYVLTGSNDGQNFVPISSGNIPSFPTRFFKQYIFFPDNTKEFSSYRLIFPTVADAASANSMQISEVEFLGHQRGGGSCTTETEGLLIRRQPEDTPVLLGATATFRVGLTGPWKVQWYRNGTAIPGANNASYTTPPVTAADDGAIYHARVGPATVGGTRGLCETSDEVMLNIFTPSTTQSIGLSWRGGGANGAPTDMLPQDITGLHLQAYWNNLAGGGGALPNPNTSDNTPHPTITVNWATSGEWGVGTGNSSPTERMLNGMVTSFATSEGNAQTVTLTGVPAGNHSVLLYTVQVPLEFFNMDFAVVTHDDLGNDVVQRRYIRPQNSDEYNPIPIFSIVSSDNPANREVGNTMLFKNVIPGADGIIQVRFFTPGRVDLPGGDPIRGPGLNGMQLVLNPGPSEDPPVIARQPASANTIVGSCFTLEVEATGANLSYEWLKNGQTIPGATGPTLTLANVQQSDGGNYAVIVANGGGQVLSRVVVVSVLSSAQITHQIISHFKFDEGSGDVAMNSVVGGQNGQVNGVALWGPGQIDGGLAMEASFDNNVFVPDYPKVSQALTVSGWLFPTTGDFGPLVNNWIEGQTTGQSGQFFVDIMVVDGVPTLRAQIEFGPNRASATAPLGDPSVLLLSWHHFAVTANGRTLNLYWDGALVGSADYLGTINSTPSIPWLSIGANRNAGGIVQPTLWGVVDDIALWRRFLSDNEIQGIYNGGLAAMSVSAVPPVIQVGNCPPLANDDSATTVEGTAVTINVLANDTDPNAGDTLTVVSRTQPDHGTNFINADNTITYNPAPGYSGPDSFTYTISDGKGGSDTATVRITVTPGNRPPTIVCPDNIVAECDGGTAVTYTVTATDPEDGNLPVTCTPPSGSNFPLGTTTVVCSATDSDQATARCTFTVTVRDTRPPTITCPDDMIVPAGTPATFAPTASDACDSTPTVTCTPASGSTLPPGAHTVNCTATDDSQNSASCSFTITVRDPNGQPRCHISVACALTYQGDPNSYVVALDNQSACVVLDGSGSADPDGDPLTHIWVVDGTLVHTGAVLAVRLPVGCHSVTLIVSDGRGGVSRCEKTVCVITPCEGILRCVELIEDADLGRKNKRPLIASLKAACASFDRGSMESGLNQLNAFQNKVNAQVARSNPNQAAAFNECIDDLREAMNCAATLDLEGACTE